MLILREQKLLFVKTKKTAGTSIEILLSEHLQQGDFATPLLPDEEKLRPKKRKIVRESVHLLRERAQGKVRARYPHLGLDVAESYLDDISSGCESFCVERNPWDKAVSAFFFWMHRRGGPITDIDRQFTAFCKKQLSYFSDFDMYSRDGRLAAGFVARYENLAVDLNEFLGSRGLLDFDISQMNAKSNVRKKRTLEEFFGENFDNKNAKRVAKIFEREIETSGYQPT